MGMIDRKKVIKGLEICTADIPIENGIHKDDMCQKCPYHNEKYAYCFEKNKLMQDALVLLKEQEAVEPRECQYPHGTYACGFCDYIPIGNKDGYRANYCPECGKAVKWDG